MMKWEEHEQDTTARFQALLPEGYTATTIGSHISNSQGDIAVYDVNTREVVVKAEAKLIPSVAGIQLVVKFDEDGKLVTRQATKNKLPYTEHILAVANAHAHQPNQLVNLEAEEAHLALQAFVSKYEADNVQLFAGKDAKSETTVILRTVIEEFSECFTPRLIIRPKKSGSSRISTKDYPLLETLLHDVNIAPEVVAGKTYIREADTHIINELNTLLSEHNFWVNKSNEVRKLSSTNNLNILVSLAFAEGYQEFEQSDAQLQALLTTFM